MITSAICDSFKQELLSGTHVFGTDTFKMALIKTTPTGTYDHTTTNYSNVTANSDEATDTSGNNLYTAGGQALSGESTSLSNGVAFVSWSSNPTWGGAATISARGCIIYNASKGNKAVAVFDFGADKSSTTGPFTVIFPTADSSNAVVRIG